MTGNDEHAIIRYLGLSMAAGLSVLFLLLAFYLIFKKDPQTQANLQTERAMSYIAMATYKKDKSSAEKHIIIARETIVQALHRTPYDPYLWVRLARIEKLLESENHDAEPAQLSTRLKPSLRAQVKREGFLGHE